MLYDYIAAALFILFGLFVPFSFLLTSKLLRTKTPGNPVKNSPYESGEKSIGSSRDLDNEYLPYFALFLPFEIIAVYMIFWAPTARVGSQISAIGSMGILVLSAVFALIGYKMISGKNV